MEFDRRQLPLSTTSADAAQLYRGAAELFLLGQAGGGDGFAAAAAVDPLFAEAHVGLAFSALYEGDVEGAAIALAVARSCATTERARGQLALVRALSELDVPTVHTEGRAHLSVFPTDDLAREAVGLVLFLLGHSQEIADLYDWLAPQQGSDWSFTASWSFACHEMGRLEESRRLGETALAARPEHTFAVHSLTHVAYESGQHADGTQMLRSFFATSEPISFHRRHLRWHLALHLLASGDDKGARELWRVALAPGTVPTKLGAVEDGAGLLWRWYLYGNEEWQLPWPELGDLARDIAQLPMTPLPAACAAVVLAALGDDVALGRLLSSADSLAAAGWPVPTRVLHGVAAAATASFAGAWGEVADALLPVQGGFSLLGGSRAQRELFEDALLFGLIRAGRGDEAMPLLEVRLERRPSDRESRLLDLVR